MKRIVTIILFVFFASSQEGSMDEMMMMSLEDLLNMEVVSATKSAISINKSPSVIRVFRKEDIEQFGFQTLNDVLINIPGMQVEDYRAGHQLAWIRGVQSRYNNKVLLLIDGVPIRDSYYGHFNLDDMIPLEIVERIEVINGPGSVLYGANALSGVISITTKSNTVSKVVGRVSKNSSIKGGVQFSNENLYIYSDYYQTDGFSPKYNSDGKAFKHKNLDATRSFGYLKYEKEGFSFYSSATQYTYPYTFRKKGQDYGQERTPLYSAFGYNTELSETSSINAKAYAQYYIFTRFKTKYKDDGSLKSDASEFLNTWLTGADIDYSFKKDNHSLVAGISFQMDSDDEITAQGLKPTKEPKEPGLFKSATRSNTALFIQDIWDVSKSFGLESALITSGIRYNAMSDFDDEINYRLGFTTQFMDKAYAKALWGTAYRVPSFREYLDVVSYNQSLGSEHLQTLEIQIGTQFEYGDMNLTFFNNSYTDFIKELNVATIGPREIDDEYAINAKSRTISGLELSSLIKPTQELTMQLGASLILSGTETLGQVDTVTIRLDEDIDFEKVDLTFLSTIKINMLTSYAFDDFIFSLNAIYYSDRNTPSDYQSKVPADIKDPSLADGYFRYDFYTSYKIMDGFKVYLKVYNAFDKAIYSPPYGGDTDYDVEWDGRRISASLSYQF